MGTNLPLFCKTPPPKLFHETIAVNNPILMEFFFYFKVVVFPMFFIQLFCGIHSHPTNGKPHETPRNPNIIIDKAPKVSDWVLEEACAASAECYGVSCCMKN